MANISYTTSFSDFFVRGGMDANIADQWKRVEVAEQEMERATERYINRCIEHSDASLHLFARFPFLPKDVYDAYVHTVYDLTYAKIEMLSQVNKYAAAQDKYNELVIAQEDWDAQRKVTAAMDDDDDVDEEDDYHFEVPEIELRKRKASRKRNTAHKKRA